MNDKNTENMQTPVDQNKKPNDQGFVKVQGHIKIFDPQTKEVFVDKRS